MMKNYANEVKSLEARASKEDRLREQRLLRDEKIEALKEKRALDQIIRRQAQSDAMRKEQHEKMQRFFKKVARDLERKRAQEARELQREAYREALGKSERIVGKIE
jgi:hypothetical protein